ncbi:MAG: hypothetical protein LBU44_07600 [Mediterranea sp.]|jgi:hypothetical protein|nr:hypothetical protein [Mediterranea sp.]
MKKEDLNINIVRGFVLLVVASSFFIEIEYLSRAFLFFGMSIGYMLFHKKALHELKGNSLLKNLKDLFVAMLLGVGISFIFISDGTTRAKAGVGFLLLSFCFLRYLKTRHK